MGFYGYSSERERAVLEYPVFRMKGGIKVLIAVVSDTHNYLSILSKVEEEIQQADMVIHLGDVVEDAERLAEGFDGTLINVRGNCDFNSTITSERLEVIEGKRVFITHGHNYNVKQDLLRLKYRAEEVEADIVLYGHTHVAKVDYENGIWFMNPGSPSICRTGCNSIGLLEIDEEKIDCTIKLIIE